MNRAFTVASLAALTVLVGCFGSYEPTDPDALAACYRLEFDTTPPETVGSLRAKQVIVRDSGGHWLRFTADEATVDSIISRGFERTEEAIFVHHTNGGNTPGWWKPTSDKLTKFYLHPNWKKHFGEGSENCAYLAHDAEKRLVYFMSQSMD